MGHELPKGFIQEVIKSEEEVEKKKERVREEVQRRTQERAARSTNDALNAMQSSFRAAARHQPRGDGYGHRGLDGRGRGGRGDRGGRGNPNFGNPQQETTGGNQE
mmetsp:Transcript_14561/g.20263  ORF Transcript_14561/g.20263 Transcript_14561/m.20263 type:complete len:105 (+) Transcript_14561:810-1124(+)